jgi:hypothetical protein
VVALELELVPAISFVGDALLTGSDGRGRGRRCGDGVVARSSDGGGGVSRRWLRPSLEIGVRVIGGKNGSLG